MAEPLLPAVTGRSRRHSTQAGQTRPRLGQIWKISFVPAKSDDATVYVAAIGDQAFFWCFSDSEIESDGYEERPTPSPSSVAHLRISQWRGLPAATVVEN